MNILLQNIKYSLQNMEINTNNLSLIKDVIYLFGARIHAHQSQLESSPLKSARDITILNTLKYLENKTLNYSEKDIAKLRNEVDYLLTIISDYIDFMNKNWDINKNSIRTIIKNQIDIIQRHYLK